MRRPPAGPIRPALTVDEAAVVVAALRYFEDTFLSGDESDETAAEASLWTYRAGRVRVRIYSALRRRGYTVEAGA